MYKMSLRGHALVEKGITLVFAWGLQISKNAPEYRNER